MTDTSLKLKLKVPPRAAGAAGSAGAAGAGSGAVAAAPTRMDLSTDDKSDSQAGLAAAPAKRPTSILEYLAQLDAQILNQLYGDTFTCLTIFR